MRPASLAASLISLVKQQQHTPVTWVHAGRLSQFLEEGVSSRPAWTLAEHSRAVVESAVEEQGMFAAAKGAKKKRKATRLGRRPKRKIK